jgi:hypothetical protein
LDTYRQTPRVKPDGFCSLGQPLNQLIGAGNERHDPFDKISIPDAGGLRGPSAAPDPDLVGTQTII